jgi:hypothetical protein
VKITENVKIGKLTENWRQNTWRSGRARVVKNCLLMLTVKQVTTGPSGGAESAAFQKTPFGNYSLGYNKMLPPTHYVRQYPGHQFLPYSLLANWQFWNGCTPGEPHDLTSTLTVVLHCVVIYLDLIFGVFLPRKPNI